MTISLDKVNFDIVELFKLRIDQNKNNLIVITGETGSGKSMAALNFAQRLDPGFGIDQCVFRVEEFLNLVETLDKGKVIVFDEAAIDFDSRRSGSTKNVEFSNLLKVFRYLNLNVIFTLPNLSMLDKNARRLMHFHGVMCGINRKSSRAKMHLYIVESHRGWDDEPVRFFPVINVENLGIVFAVDPVWTDLPPADLRDAYQKKKESFTASMFSQMKKSWRSSPEEDRTQPAPAPAPAPAWDQGGPDF